MKRYPKSQVGSYIKKGAAILFAAEAVIFGGIYYVYHRMNTERDFRYYMNNNYPYGLEVYYSVGEFFQPANQTRKTDANIWSIHYPSRLNKSDRTVDADS